MSDQPNKPEVPETVILDMQERARHRKAEISKLKETAAARQADYVKAKHNLDVAEASLCEIADFLQEHNAEAVGGDGSWHLELGLKKPE